MTQEMDMTADILVADQDNTLRTLLETSLIRAGHNVRLAENGPDTLELIRNEMFDLAIIEFSLPGLSALDILSRLKKSGDQIPHTLILSSGGTMDSIRACVEAGAKDFVVKPFKLPLLLERIGVVLKKVRTA